MKINELHYFAIPNGTTVNFYKTELTGTTYYSKAKYRSGWYSAEAVDNLFGKVEDVANPYDRTKTQLKDSLNKAVLKTYSAYWRYASKPDADADQVNLYLDAIRRIRAFPSGTSLDPTTTYEIDYDPANGLAVRHSDEKMLFVLSANPDDILKDITDFAENSETIKGVNNLSTVVAQKNLLEKYEKLEGAKYHNDLDKKVLASRFNKLLLKLNDTTSPLSDADLEAELQKLQEAIKQQKNLR